MHDKDATPIEAIDFESLQTPPEQSKESNRSVNHKLIIWFAFIFLLLCALMVFIFLPKYVAEKRASSTPESSIQIETPIVKELATEIVEEPIAQLSADQLDALKQEAEKLLLEIIDKQKLLEDKAVKKWAADEFKIAETLGSEGDEHFRKKEYKQAISSYKDIITILSDLEKQIAPTLATHLEKGELALLHAEQTSALHHFELAQAIDKHNLQATNGLKRTATIKELYALLDKGGKLEAANRLSEAENIYKQASKLDPLSNEAKLALQRVVERLTQIEFTQLLNQGYASLKLGQYSDAKTAFNAAQKLSPNSEKPKLGLAKIRQTQLNERLLALSTEAQHFENAQDWANAVQSYQQILDLAPNHASAQQGLQQSQQRKQLLLGLNEYIENKLRLNNEDVANDAQQLLNETAALNKPGSKIEQAALTLKELLYLAKQPISITLQSDNKTDIAIYKVGKFGKFERLEIELKPGKYTIVGSRSGFRDVRKVITVLADMTDKTIDVRCDESI